MSELKFGRIIGHLGQKVNFPYCPRSLGYIFQFSPVDEAEWIRIGPLEEIHLFGRAKLEGLMFRVMVFSN